MKGDNKRIRAYIAYIQEKYRLFANRCQANKEDYADMTKRENECITVPSAGKTYCMNKLLRIRHESCNKILVR